MKFTKTGFKAWLEAKKPDDKVGRAKRRCSCPLATYLKDKTGQRWSVGQIWYSIPDAIYYMPLWAETFVRRVDKLKGAVTASQALERL